MTEANTAKRFYTAKEIIQILGVSRPFGYMLINSEGFPKIRLNRKILVPVLEFENWLAKQQGGN